MFNLTNQYYFLERNLFTFAASVILLFVFHNYKPIHEIAFVGFHSVISIIASALLIFPGLYIFVRSQMEMSQDMYGFYLMNYFKKEGNEFPVPFKINEFTRL